MRQGPLFGGLRGSSSPIPPTPPLGPLDVVGRVNGFFTNFSQEFTLEADCAVVGLCCSFSGDPDITVKHGADTLNILRQERSGDLLSLLAFGSDLAIETANVTVSATGGELNGGALRIHEVYKVSATGNTGWIGGASGLGNEITPINQQSTVGGLTKGALVAGAADRYHTMSVTGSDKVWSGFTTSGILIDTDTTTAGPWVLGAGWSIDGDDFVHTGPESVLQIAFPTIPALNSARMEADVSSGEITVGGTTSTYDRYKVGNHYVCTAHGFPVSQLRITSNGDCRIKGISVVYDARAISWLFCSADSQNGGEISFTQPYAPAWAYSMAEVACMA